MQETQTVEKKEKRGSGRSNLWFLLINVVVIAAIAIREFGSGERPQKIAMREINPWFLLAALGCFLIMLFSETWKYARLLRETGHARPMHTGFRCAILGKYFDNITPAGFGGQPFQIHYLKTHGCSDGVSGSLPILGFLGLQFTFIFLALIVFLFGSRVFKDLLTVRLAAWAGLLLYSFVPVCVVLFSIVPKPLMRLVHGGTRLLQKIHIVKNAEATSAKAIAALQSYTDSVRYFSSQPRMLAVVILMSLIFRLAMVAMPWFVLRAFGADVSFLRCCCQVTYIYAVITLIPTPGNSGAAEASFYTVFSMLAPGTIFWAMLVWRLLCYYSWLLCGAAHYISKAKNESKPYRDLAEGEQPNCSVFVDSFFPQSDEIVESVDDFATHVATAVVCPNGGEKANYGTTYQLLRTPAIRLPWFSHPIGLPEFSGRTKQALHKGNYRILHAHSPFTIGHFALRMGRRMGVPVVATVHQKMFDDLQRLRRFPALHRAVTGYVGRFYKQADAVWANGPAAARALKSCGYDGKIRVMRRFVTDWPETAAKVDEAYREVIRYAAEHPQPRD